MTVSFSQELPRRPDAGTQARGLIRRRLADVVPASTVEDVALAVSELVTNAVRHGDGRIELRIEVTDRSVKGEVIDGGGGFEYEMRSLGFDEVGRRGLQIVGELSEQWGIHEGTTHVWFEVSIRDPPKPSATVEDPALGKPDEEQRPQVD
jgi:anti-sigma regulatory factor (Ser/Thr protein kinase)